jgi:hypothetical protein
MELFRQKDSKKHTSLSTTVESGNGGHPDEKNAPIAAGDFNEEHKLFDLFINDYVLANDKHGNRSLCRILSISEGDIELRIHNDGRRSEDVKKSDDRFRIRRKLIQNRGFQKVTISPAGLLRDAATNEIIYKIE